MKKTRRLLAVALAIIMLLAVIPFGTFTASALESTGNATFDAFINDARWTDGIWWGDQSPKLNPSAQFSQCAAYCYDFVAYCFDIYNPRGGEVFYSASEIRAGDVITVGNPSNGNGHWFAVLKRSGNSLYVAEGNYAGKVRIGWNYSVNGSSITGTSYGFNAGYHFASADTQTNNDPIGFIDVIYSENKQLIIKGWAYDPDSSNKPVSLHVYVGGKAGTNASGYNRDENGNVIKANLWRPDLERYWGFETRININEIGYQNIYVYAINNEGGNNPELELTTGISRNVFINQNPIGYIEEIHSENEQIIIKGWAYDPDSSNKPVSLHVYVGDKAGTNASHYTKDVNGNDIKANLYRSDIDRNWGYEARIDVKETGYQNIYIYAINNEGGNNPELGLITGISRNVFINGKLTENPDFHTPGDTNGDGAVNNKDLTRLFQYLSDWDVEVNEAALDINGDGKVNNRDLTRLFQYLSDWDVEIF